MLACARVGGRCEGRRSRTSARVACEGGGWRFAFVVAVVLVVATGGLDAHDQRGIFDRDGAGGDEVAKLVDVEGCWLWGLVGREEGW